MEEISHFPGETENHKLRISFGIAALQAEALSA
jgi:hypothetical protein